MIPILYESNEKLFESNGLGRLRDCISAIVTEERNGIYELDFQYPVDGEHFDLIKIGRIVAVTHDAATEERPYRVRGPITDETNTNITDEDGLAFTGSMTQYAYEHDVQPFDIVSYTRPIDGVVSFHCVHISYRLSFQTVWATSVNSLSAAFNMFKKVPNTPFLFTTDKRNVGRVAAFDGVPRTVRSILGGVEGSILDSYGGEYEWDKFNVILHSARGVAREFSIRYGVNMLDYEEEYDNSEAYSSCVPYWTDGTNLVVGSRQDATIKTITRRGECVPLDVSDKFENKPSKAQVEAMAKSMMRVQNPAIPAQNIHVEFVRLQDLGYEELGKLYECKLCDTINVVFPDYDVTEQFKIVRTEWNVLADRYESMDLGDLSVTLSEALGISDTRDSGYLSADSNGDVSIPGSVTVSGHASQIGYFTSNSGSSTIANGTTLKVLSGKITLSAGTWVLIASAAFAGASDATSRGLCWYSSDAIGASRVTQTAINSSTIPTRMQSVLVSSITGNTDYWLYCFQNSSASINVDYYWRAIRIA